MNPPTVCDTTNSVTTATVNATKIEIKIFVFTMAGQGCSKSNPDDTYYIFVAGVAGVVAKR